ncbi:hypothetical protein ACFV6U_03865, partial [Streptomyces sp. NPDC059810]
PPPPPNLAPTQSLPPPPLEALTGGYHLAFAVGAGLLLAALALAFTVLRRPGKPGAPQRTTKRGKTKEERAKKERAKEERVKSPATMAA